MPQLLEMTHFMDDNGMPQMEIGSGRVETDFDIERFVPRKFFAQVLFADQINNAAADNFYLFINTFER